MKPLIIFGPSGVGKGTIISFLQQKNPNLFKLSTSYTTRKPRPKQIHGQHYYFVTKQQFQQKINNNEMLEHKIVFGNMYGSCRKNVEDIILQQKIPILDVDVEGMIDIQRSIKDTLSNKQTNQKSVSSNIKQQLNMPIDTPLCLCILPPSFKLLRQRLTNRKTQSQQIVQKRMQQNLNQLKRMISIQHQLNNKQQNAQNSKASKVQHLFYSTNYQYQSTVYGIQKWLEKYHPYFKGYKMGQYNKVREVMMGV